MPRCWPYTVRTTPAGSDNYSSLTPATSKGQRHAYVWRRLSARSGDKGRIDGHLPAEVKVVTLAAGTGPSYRSPAAPVAARTGTGIACPRADAEGAGRGRDG